MTAPVLQPGPRFSGAPAARLAAGETRAPGLYITVLIDGTTFGPYGPTPGPFTGASDIQVGSAYSIEGAVADRDIDNVLVGTADFGSSDVFACDFSGAIVPPFDSESITGDGTLSIAAGALHVTGTTDGAVTDALKDFGALYQNLAVQMDVRMAADEIAAAGQTGNFFDISANNGGDIFGGIWFDFDDAGWSAYGNGMELLVSPFWPVYPFAPAAATWYTIGMKFEIVT